MSRSGLGVVLAALAMACAPTRKYVEPVEDLPFVDSKRIGLVGWSHGGTTALMTWTRNSVEVASFAAFVAYYPYYFDADRSSASAPLLILIGERDDWCPATMCKDLIARAKSLGIDASVTIYPGASHAFDSIDGGKTVEFVGHTLTPDPAASRDARERLLAFFDRTRKKP